MPFHWKLLVVSMLVMQVIGTLVMLDLADYAVWLHFDSGATGLTDTLPGRTAALWLGIPAGLLLLLNVWAFTRAVEPQPPASEAPTEP